MYLTKYIIVCLIEYRQMCKLIMTGVDAGDGDGEHALY